MALSTSATSVAGDTRGDMMESAGRLVDKHVSADQSFYELSGLLRVATHRSANASGFNDSDYPILSSSLPALGDMPLLGGVSHTSLPPELVTQFDNMQCNCAMGLLPVIRRAWLTIDNTLYMWNYENGKDVAYFDGLKETILSVGLVVPRPGVFQDHILFLLCLTTPVELVMLGISFTSGGGDPYNEMHLLPEALFSLPTDNVSMISIVGTATGRVLMAGKDGCLYEIKYQAEDGWFSRRCSKINHSISVLSYLVPSFLSFADEDPLVQLVEDGSRNILYTRSRKGTIQVYDLGHYGLSTSRVCAISHDSIVYRACESLRSNDRSLISSFVHMAVIPTSESSTLHLVVITQTGVRLYFTTTPHGISCRPSILALVHIRLAPGFSPSRNTAKPGNTVQRAFYRKGCLLLSCNHGAGSGDTIWLMDPDPFPFPPMQTLVEAHVQHPLPGGTWAIGECIEAGELEAVDSNTPLPPTVVNQHSIPQRRFIILTTQGSFILTKPRPVDQLSWLLDQYRTGCCEAVEQFFHLHKQTQACAMCLILATGPNRELASLATEAYLKYGGEPHFIFPTTIGPQSPLSVSSPFSSYQSPQPGYVTFPSTPPGTLGRAVLGPEVQASGRQEGLSLYLARLLRPLWEAEMVVTVPPESYGQQEKLKSAIDVNDLAILAEMLCDIKAFLDRNMQFLTTASTGDSSKVSSPANMHQRMLQFMRPDGMPTDSPSQAQQSLHNKYRAEAYLKERVSLNNLYHLITRCCECLLLWKLLCEHQFDIVVSGLDKAQHSSLKTTTLKSLVTGGKQVPSSLISALLSHYAGDSSLMDPLTSQLRQLCPALFSEDDAIASKGQELVTIATTVQSPAEKQSMLRDSLKLFSQVTQQISLPVICDQYKSLRYYEGVVELALCTAAHRDPQNMALLFYRSGQSMEDTAGQKALADRQEAYSVITSILNQLLQQTRTGPHSPTIPSQPGPPPSQQDNGEILKTDPKKDFESMLLLALRSDDELFHITLYSWLMSDDVKMSDRLVEIKSSYVEGFLKYMSSLQADSLPILNLLWRYYETNRLYMSAAKILHQLAHWDRPGITLDQRMEYISRAVLCAKSCSMVTSVSGEGEFLHELEEKMEVARIQLGILECIKSLSPSHDTHLAITALNAELMDISKLYGDYAEPFELSECKLTIIHCAGHYDPTLVDSLWAEIIDKELTQTQRHAKSTRMQSMIAKLVKLGQLYCRSERYFPLGYLIKLLEQHCCELQWQCGYIPTTFHQIGVSYPALFNIYNNLYHEKDPCWQSLGSPLHLLSVLVSIISSYTSNPSLVSSYERPSFSTLLLDSTTHYLVELQAMSSSIAGLSAITADLRNLQRHIKTIM